MTDLGGGGSNVAKIIVGLVAVLIGCGGFGGAYYIDGVNLDAKALEEVEATVATVAIATKSDQAGKTVFHPSYSFDFEFKGQTMLVENIVAADGFATQAEAHAFTAKFTEGAKKQIFVDPEHPTRVVLTREEYPSSYMYIAGALGLVFVIIGLGFLFS